jgi:hypothetical protein
VLLHVHVINFRPVRPAQDVLKCKNLGHWKAGKVVFTVSMLGCIINVKSDRVEHGCGTKTLKHPQGQLRCPPHPSEALVDRYLCYYGRLLNLSHVYRLRELRFIVC